MKSILYVVSKGPYAGSHDLELLEAAMVGAVFECETSLLFRDEGVWCLLRGQDASPLGRRTVGKTLAALPTYEVDRIYVCAESLAARRLAPADVPGAKPLTLEEQAKLMAAQDAVVGAQS